MFSGSLTRFAETASPQSGIGAFNVNAKAFVFQLITFLLVLLVFKKWILPPILKTLDDRRNIVEKSLTDAKRTEEALVNAETKSEEILAKARAQADESLAEAKKAAAGYITAAESKAAERASLIVKDAETKLGEEREKLRHELRQELAVLVADATAKVIDEKLDAKHDMSLIERAIKGIAR